MPGKTDIKSPLDNHQGSLEQAPNLSFDLFGRLTKLLKKQKKLTHQEQEPRFDEECAMSNQSNADNLEDVDLQGDLSTPNIEERLPNVNRKTLLFAGYIILGVLFVSGGAAAATLIARNAQDIPTLAPTIAPTGAPTMAPTIAPTIAPTRAPTMAPTIRPTVAATIEPTAPPTIAPTMSAESILHLNIMSTLDTHFASLYGGECTASAGDMECTVPYFMFGSLCDIKPISAEYQWDENSNRPTSLSVTTCNPPKVWYQQVLGYNTEVISLDHSCDEDCFKERLDRIFK